jgi:exopolysaccharide biosynthesis polyprenyl glycosylphosphotransferase
MSGAWSAGAVPASEPLDLVGSQTPEILRPRRRRARPRRRGWLVRRALVIADVSGLIAAFAVAQATFSGSVRSHPAEWAALIAMLPPWILIVKGCGLYDRDDQEPTHSTVNDVVGVFHVITVGVWLLLVGATLSGAANPDVARLAGFWLIAIAFVTLARSVARAAAHRSLLYVQNLLIFGAGDVGQLVARKVLQHPEYGLNVVGFVDDEPRDRRHEVADIAVFGPGELREVVRRLDVDRVVVAFSRSPDPQAVALVRSLRDLDVQIDVVPRLFDVIGPNVANHSLEALPLIGLPPLRRSRSSRAAKRALDVVGASLGLVVTLPLFVVIAVLIRRDSRGPVLFRQTRLGLGMREFTALKFRTMVVDADDRVHRDYIRRTMSASAVAESTGIFKLERPDAVTALGRWLRRTSLDELPQLINVLRGEMSLVGPRPCIPYEVEHFRPHQFERFLVPAGITGLWQVLARSRATFGEALDMDVAYARSWSLWLDLQLLCRTPLQVLRHRKTA